MITDSQYFNAIWDVPRVSIGDAEGYERMSGHAQQESTLGLLNRGQLLKLKLKAMRRGVWFRALPRIDRVLFDLTIKIGKDVRSRRLATSILQVAGKLQEFFESRLARATREFGFTLAQKMGEIAVAWGNRAAKFWLTDQGFAQFLAMMQLNSHGASRT